MPDLNPVVAPDAYCSTCGTKMEKEVEHGPGKRVVGVWYKCVNEATGCRYRVYSDARLNGQTLPVPAEKG